MFIINHSYASMIYAFLPHLCYLIFDPRNFEQLKDQKRELEVSLKTNFEFFSKLWDWIKFGFTKIHFHYIKNKIKREDKMTSSKIERKYWKLNLASKYICWVLFALYFISLAQKLFLKSCILGRINVHKVIYKTI